MTLPHTANSVKALATIRNLLRFEWSRDSAGFLIGNVVADSFCYQWFATWLEQLSCVADGRFGPEWIEQTLANKVSEISDSLVISSLRTHPFARWTIQAWD